VLSGVLLIATIFVPIWSISLDAPQYPEGLELKLHANKISGDVDVINGLNHYIGMKTLHTENFFEFTVLPYILSGFAAFFLILVFMNKKKGVLIAFVAFMLFAVLSAIDFYRWNYDYGHNLDPTAAIQVPGMAYQPPMLGFKQLLNFGAYSFPDTGGWLLFLTALILFVAVAYEYKHRIFKRKNKMTQTSMVLFALMLVACGPKKMEPIALNKDQCDFCKMSIADGKYGAELITEKGRIYKFDDLHCMIGFKNENSTNKVQNFFIHNYTRNNQLIPAETAFYIQGGELVSPMNGNIAAFATELEADQYAKKMKAQKISWASIVN
jgi:copper chaperone NosL